jgi:hypothetical protein
VRRQRGILVAVLGAVVGLAPQAASAQQQREPSPTRIVRCRPGLDIPCAVTSVELEPDEARREPNDSTGRWWTGRLAGADLSGIYERSDTANAPLWKLLILLDLSGSMRGEGLRYARSGLRGFIRGLPQEGVVVAVAPFESRQVVARITSARFVPPSQALQVLDALPQPDVSANTALYSAVVAGLERLDGEMRGAEPGTRGGLVLLTDGKNDVRGRGDDPGLLSGPAGRRSAADVAAKSPHQIWIVGAGSQGSVDREELATLAGSRGEALVDSLDAVVLGNHFGHIGRQIVSAREVTLRVEAPSVTLLSRAAGAGALQGNAGGAGERAAVVRLIEWRPPLLALPAYEGVADSFAVAGIGSTRGLEEDWSRRLVVAVALVLFWLALTASLPSLFGPPVRGATAADGQAEIREPVAQKIVAARDDRSTGLRIDAKEAPPRKPDEITASSARKVSPLR